MGIAFEISLGEWLMAWYMPCQDMAYDGHMDVMGWEGTLCGVGV
jgi:hypothetical protein